MEPLLTTEDVAEWLRMDVVTVRRLIARGEIPAYRVGGEFRFRGSELQDFLDSQRVPTRIDIGDGGKRSGLKAHLKKLGGGNVSGEPFDSYSTRARTVLFLAQQQAQQLGHSYLGTEHLLLGLVAEGEGIAARVLAELGVTLDGSRNAVERHLGASDVPTVPSSGERCLTPRTKKMLELASEESQRLNHRFVGTEHLLLGMIREGSGVGARVLHEMTGDLKSVRAAVEKALERVP